MTFQPRTTRMASSPDTSPGLSSVEVAERAARGLINTYQARTSRTYRQIFTDNLFNVFNITLAVLLGFLLVLGRASDTLFAGGSVVANTLIGLIQEIRAKRALDKLAALSAGSVRVRRASRDGENPVGPVAQ